MASRYLAINSTFLHNTFELFSSLSQSPFLALLLVLQQIFEIQASLKYFWALGRSLIVCQVTVVSYIT